MQRSSVLLPEPLLPMMAMTSPARTSRSMPFSTSFAPKRLRSPATWTMTGAFGSASMQMSFEGFAPGRDRPAEQEVHERDDGIDRERAEGRVGDHRRRLGQLDEADHRCERRALDHLDEKTHRRRDRDLQRLRADDVAQL